jgi:hypothetical protein
VRAVPEGERRGALRQLTVRYTVDGREAVVTVKRVRLRDKEKAFATLKSLKLPVAMVSDGFPVSSVMVSAAYTLMDLERGMAIAKDAAMQFMLNLTGTHQLSRAIELSSPVGDTAYVVDMGGKHGDLDALCEDLDLSLEISKPELVKIFAARAEGRNWKYKKPT